MSGQEDCEGEGDNYLSEVSEEEESEERESPRFSAAKARRAIIGLTSESSDNEDYPPSLQLKTSLATKLKRATAKAKKRSLEKTLPSQAGHPGATTPPAAKRAKVIQGVEGKNKRSMNEHSSSSSHPVTPDVDTRHELQKTNELLVQLVGRMKKTEQRVRRIEDRLLAPSGNSSSCGSTPQRYQSRRKSVPPEVRVSILFCCINVC